MLKQKILNRRPGIITYGITPPKKNNSNEKIIEISEKQVEQISKLKIDGLVIYDIQDEKDRNTENRPFPFIETIDPLVYSEQYLKDLEIPKIIYRCVGKYSKSHFGELIESNNNHDTFSVFVGASSKNQEVSLSLSDAYNIAKEIHNSTIIGGVAIPERHTKNYDEHIRIINKMGNGCKYFITQAVYNIEAAKNFLSDYYYFCMNNKIDMIPIILTFTPCGSVKTLEFMKWLGISMPVWLENDLKNSDDILYKSVSLAKAIFCDLLEFCTEKKIPIGCNIESVSIRKVEIEASLMLTNDIISIFNEFTNE